MKDYSQFIKNYRGSKIKVYSKRPKDLGLLIVVGGPGGSGASTIARQLAVHFGLQYVYGGGIMRSIARNLGFETLEDFLASDYMKKQSSLIDRQIDEKILKSSFARNVLIDSKDFAAISTYRQIPSTVKIWLTADIDVRVHRVLWSNSLLPKDKTISKRSKVYKDVSLKLMKRYSNDKNRYKKLYDIDYDNVEKYNDIVIDTSKMNVSETFNLILKLINENGYLK